MIDLDELMVKAVKDGPHATMLSHEALMSLISLARSAEALRGEVEELKSQHQMDQHNIVVALRWKEEAETKLTEFYKTVERLGLAEMVEMDDDDNTVSTWINGRADWAEKALLAEQAHSQELAVRAESAESSLAAVKGALEDMEARKDDAYFERNNVVAALARLYPSGIARTNIPGWSEDWHGCVYIDLPSGQISYHCHDSQAYLFASLPPYAGTWDGHDKDEVHRRLSTLTRQEKP